MSKKPLIESDIEPLEFASPPCYAHEMDPSYMGLDIKNEQECKRPKQNKANCEPLNSKKS